MSTTSALTERLGPSNPEFVASNSSGRWSRLAGAQTQTHRNSVTLTLVNDSENRVISEFGTAGVTPTNMLLSRPYDLFLVAIDGHGKKEGIAEQVFIVSCLNRS